MIIIKDPNSVNYIKMNKAYFNDKEYPQILVLNKDGWVDRN